MNGIGIGADRIDGRTVLEQIRATATRDIDAALMTALRESKPVYLGIPSDVAVAPVHAANLRHPLVAASSDTGELARFTTALAEAVAVVATTLLLIGHARRRRVRRRTA